MSYLSCPVTDNFIWNEHLWRGHLSYRVTCALPQRWRLNAGLTEYLLHWSIELLLKFRPSTTMMVLAKEGVSTTNHAYTLYIIPRYSPPCCYIIIACALYPYEQKLHLRHNRPYHMMNLVVNVLHSHQYLLKNNLICSNFSFDSWIVLPWTSFILYSIVQIFTTMRWYRKSAFISSNILISAPSTSKEK